MDGHLPLLAQLQDPALARLAFRPGAGSGLLRRFRRRLEEGPARIGAEGRAEVAEAADAVAEGLRGGLAVHAVDVAGAQCLVASLCRALRLEKCVAEFHNRVPCTLHTRSIYHVIFRLSTASCGVRHEGS